MRELLKTLCNLDGVSGYEDEVRSFIKSAVEPYADEYFVDALGNLLVFRKGKHRRTRVMLVAAHMDETGLLVESICEDGCLRLCSTVVQPQVLLGTRLRVGSKRIKGVMCQKAIHLQKEEERKIFPPLSSLVLDIGADSRQSAQQLVSIGDPVTFDSLAQDIGADCLMAKAIDDRVGCAIMIKLIEQSHLYDTWYAFTVEEEIGAQSAGVVARCLDPGVTLVLEGTTCKDVGNRREHMLNCCLRKGCAISLCDTASLYHPRLRQLAKDIAKDLNQNWQWRYMQIGSTDNGALHTGASGAQAVGLNVPVRSIHSACGIAYYPDIQATFDIAKAMIERTCDCNV